MAKKKGKTPKQVFELPDGTVYRVTGEDGVYIFCEREKIRTQFRKAAKRGILRDETAEDFQPAPEENDAEPEQEEE